MPALAFEREGGAVLRSMTHCGGGGGGDTVFCSMTAILVMMQMGRRTRNQSPGRQLQSDVDTVDSEFASRESVKQVAT